MSLYYLLPSLPMLSMDTAPGLSPEAFLGACREQLSASDASAAEALFRGQPSGHPFVVAWQDKEAILRNAMARERARLTGGDASRWQRPAQGCDSQIESLVEDAFQESDQLKREKALDKIRWQIAEELQGPDPLSVKVAFVYAIKLALLVRWLTLSTDRGLDLFNALTHVPLTLNPEP
jgi:hypothetical protein